MLVALVVFVFLRDWRATLIPVIAVPISLVGTFAAMYLLDYSLDNLSLMALIVATGFVVDDAVVVLENIIRHVEDGVAPMQAALRGAREVGFTVLSMSLSLVAVFLPVLLMGGIIGRLFREFAATLVHRHFHFAAGLAYPDADAGLALAQATRRSQARAHSRHGASAPTQDCCTAMIAA